MRAGRSTPLRTHAQRAVRTVVLGARRNRHVQPHARPREGRRGKQTGAGCKGWARHTSGRAAAHRAPRPPPPPPPTCVAARRRQPPAQPRHASSVALLVVRGAGLAARGDVLESSSRSVVVSRASVRRGPMSFRQRRSDETISKAADARNDQSDEPSRAHHAAAARHATARGRRSHRVARARGGAGRRRGAPRHHSGGGGAFRARARADGPSGASPPPASRILPPSACCRRVGGRARTPRERGSRHCRRLEPWRAALLTPTPARLQADHLPVPVSACARRDIARRRRRQSRRSASSLCLATSRRARQLARSPSRTRSIA